MKNHGDVVAALDAFEKAWKEGMRPNLDRFLPDPDDPTSRMLAHELAKMDLDYRIRAREAAPLAGTYFSLPHFSFSREEKVQLIGLEYQWRWEQGETTLRQVHFSEWYPELADLLVSLRPRWNCPRCKKKKILLDEEDTSQAVCPRCREVFSLVSIFDPKKTVLPQPVPSRAVDQGLPNLPGYKILAEIGRGAMGVVYKARHLQLNRVVALKMIRAGSQANSEELLRFRTEAEAVAQLQYPHIVQIHEVGEHEGMPYFSLEFVEGGTLAKKIDGTPRPAQEAAATVETVARAMHAAHQRGIVHRDLKPLNILLTAEGQPKIADFGLAKKLEAPGQTQSGAVLGTPSYMAPEQAAGKTKDIGAAADVYALGATLYEMLTGRPPFRAENPLETLIQVISDEPVGPRRLNRKVPRDLETICLKCLNKKPSRRYTTALALADDLALYQAGQPILARPVGWPEKTAKWARRYPAWASVIVLAAILVILGLAGVFWYQQDQASRQTEILLRRADDDRKKALAEGSIRVALENAAKNRQELEGDLHKPGGIFLLLNDPNRWIAQIQASQAALKQARALVTTAEETVAQDLMQNLEELEKLVQQDEANRLLALQIEKIRLDSALHVKGEVDWKKPAREYPRIFANAEFSLLEDKVSVTAARIRSSPTKDLLVAALDEWAVIVRTENPDLLKRLLEIARLADPEPVGGDRFRQPKFFLGKDDKAFSAFILETPFDKLSSRHLEAVYSLIEADDPNREKWLRKAQAQHPNDFWLNVLLGRLLREEKQMPYEAEGFFWTALAIRPNTPVVYIHIGDALCDQERWDEAFAAYGKVIELDPQANAFRNRGLAWYNKKDYDKAIQDYNEAIRLDPNYAYAFHNRGLAWYNKKDYHKAIHDYTEAIRLDPKYAGAFNSRGVAWYYKKAYDKAIEDYNEAIRLNPKYAGAFNDRGLAWYYKKAHDKAIEDYNEAIRLNPKYAGAFNNRGVAWREKKEYEKAIEDFSEGVFLDPNHAHGFNYLAWLLATCPDPKYRDGLRAAKLAEKACELSEWKTAMYWGTLAAAKAEAGFFEDAIRWQKKALEDSTYAGEFGKEALKRLALYKAKKPYHQGLSGVPPAPKNQGGMSDIEELHMQKLWSKVDMALQPADGRFIEKRFQGTLTNSEKSKVHELEMKIGKTYILELESSAFDTFLKLEDAKRKLVVQNDDISEYNRNSRIVFTAKEGGVYRMVATSFQQSGSGAYTLTVRVNGEK
jgi:tetratricopeptide (TPR) repeat protein/tRNA A-37 threonylcarbamoyl transferase component Bud32